MLDLLKKQRAIKIKCAQTHLKSVLGHHANYQKKTKKKLLNRGNLVSAKGNQGRNLSLDLGFIFGKPTRCVILLQNLNIWRTKKEATLWASFRSML